MTDNDKALATELRGIAAELSCNQYAAQVWVIGQAANRIEAQAAEIERLRAALERIASGRYSGIILTSFPPKDAAVEAARAALGGKE